MRPRQLQSDLSRGSSGGLGLKFTHDCPIKTARTKGEAARRSPPYGHGASEPPAAAAAGASPAGSLTSHLKVHRRAGAAGARPGTRVTSSGCRAIYSPASSRRDWPRLSVDSELPVSPPAAAAAAARASPGPAGPGPGRLPVTQARLRLGAMRFEVSFQSLDVQLKPKTH